MAWEDLVAWEMILAAFAGGAFGAAIGALQSFSLAGLIIILGEVHAVVYRTIGVGEPPIDITGSIGFGVVLGPHIAFGGGAAAVAYAANRGYLDSDFEYHPAKNVIRGFAGKPDVLFIGGVFGIIGYWIATASTSLSVPTDGVALGVVGSAILHRLSFGYSIFGAPPSQWFDMKPFEQGVRRQDELFRITDGGSERLTVEPWLPYQYRWSHVGFLGVITGVLGGYIAYLTGSAFLAFGLSVVVLAFLFAGVKNIPVTHHMTLPASAAVIASVDPALSTTPANISVAIPLGEALILGAIFGVIGAVIGEIAQRVFYAHADTHLDPPAVSIVLTTFIIALLAWIGYFPSAAWIPMP